MKLRKDIVRLPKNTLYDRYVSIVHSAKSYDNISRAKMLDEILDEYSNKEFLVDICTCKELEFLKIISKKKISEEDVKKYEWEIEQLDRKLIFSRISLDLFEEQKKNVSNALECYEKIKENKKKKEEIIIFMVGYIKINGEVLIKALQSLVLQIFKVDTKAFYDLLESPLINFYCDYGNTWIESFKAYEVTIFYVDYEELLEELNDARRKYATASGMNIDIRDYYDAFYKGFPLRNSKVKEMYELINQYPTKRYLFVAIDIARLLNCRDNLKNIFRDEKTLKVVNDALDYLPCAAMNGCSPIENAKCIMEEEEINDKFDLVPQHDAHLCKAAADEFYKLYFALLEYANNKIGINKSLKRIYKQENLFPNDLFPIDDYLWAHKELIDEFINKNEYNFSKEELDIVFGFKEAIKSDRFILAGFEREYTKILSFDGKVYMIKGIRCDMDKIVPHLTVPQFLETTLLPFKGKIIFCSLIKTYGVSFGNNFKKSVLKELKAAVKYYHL